MPTLTPKPPEQLILKAALSIASEKKWYNISLCDVATVSKLTLIEVISYFPDTNAIANAWFEQALYAMLAPLPKTYDKMLASERLEMLMWRWFEALNQQRLVTLDMLASKFHLPHVHHWAPLAFTLSRHVQLWRETAKLTAVGRQRQIQEIGLTTIFLATLSYWRHDTSEGQKNTRVFLHKKLKQGNVVMCKLFNT